MPALPACVAPCPAAAPPRRMGPDSGSRPSPRHIPSTRGEIRRWFARSTSTFTMARNDAAKLQHGANHHRAPLRRGFLAPGRRHSPRPHPRRPHPAPRSLSSTPSRASLLASARACWLLSISLLSLASTTTPVQTSPHLPSSCHSPHAYPFFPARPPPLSRHASLSTSSSLYSGQLQHPALRGGLWLRHYAETLISTSHPG